MMKDTSTTKRIARLTLGLVLTAATSIAMAQSGPGKGETLRVQDYPGLANTLVRVADSKQFCEKHGIKCVLRQLPNGPIGTQAFLAGELEVAYVGSEVMLPAISRGANVKMISGGFAPQPFFVVTRLDADFPDAAKGYQGVMSSLRGKKVGVPARGSHGEVLFTDMLIDSGLTAKDVTFVAVGGPGTALPPLINKQIDALIIFSPVDGMCEVTQACKVVIDLRQGAGPQSVQASLGAAVPLWMKEDYIQKNPDSLKAFRMALADAQAFIRDPANFDEILEIIERYSKMPGDNGSQIMGVALRNSLPGFDITLKPTALQAVIDYMVENKQLPSALSAEDLVVR